MYTYHQDWKKMQELRDTDTVKNAFKSMGGFSDFDADALDDVDFVDYVNVKQRINARTQDSDSK